MYLRILRNKPYQLLVRRESCHLFVPTFELSHSQRRIAPVVPIIDIASEMVESVLPGVLGCHIYRVVEVIVALAPMLLVPAFSTFPSLWKRIVQTLLPRLLRLPPLPPLYTLVVNAAIGTGIGSGGATLMLEGRVPSLTSLSFRKSILRINLSSSAVVDEFSSIIRTILVVRSNSTRILSL